MPESEAIIDPLTALTRDQLDMLVATGTLVTILLPGSRRRPRGDGTQSRVRR
jgi:hypothetical protein